MPFAPSVPATVSVSIAILMLLLLQLAEVFVESLEALLPVPSVVPDPVGHVTKRLRLEPTRSPLGLPTLLDQPGSLKDPEVLRDGRQAEVIERGSELSHRRLTLGQAGEDGPPCRICQGGKREAQGIGQGRVGSQRRCVHFTRRLI